MFDFEKLDVYQKAKAGPLIEQIEQISQIARDGDFVSSVWFTLPPNGSLIITTCDAYRPTPEGSNKTKLNALFQMPDFSDSESEPILQPIGGRDILLLAQ